MYIGNLSFTEAGQSVLAGSPLSGSELDHFVQAVACSQGDQFDQLLAAARDIRIQRLGRTVSLCAIVNAKSGRCSENCAFCAQSAHHETNAPVHPFMGPGQIAQAADAMRRMGARRFGIVTSGLSPSGDDFKSLLESVRAVSELGMEADASCGVLNREQLTVLKAAGLKAYHHNLETARSFFPRICTTHDYERDVQTVRDALAEGLYVCSGGIFGLGESWNQRAELALTLRELGVVSVPMNFLLPIKGTPMGERTPLSPEEALKVIALFRFLLPDAHIRICGGRQIVFGPEDAILPLEAGASGLMIGDYLTTKGLDANSDREGILKAGWEISGD
jgi:biotin synthase